jgi:hypothetical protein
MRLRSDEEPDEEPGDPHEAALRHQEKGQHLDHGAAATTAARRVIDEVKPTDPTQI